MKASYPNSEGTASAVRILRMKGKDAMAFATEPMPFCATRHLQWIRFEHQARSSARPSTRQASHAQAAAA